MCAIMADIQSVMAENRRGKKKERKKKPQGKNIMSASAMQGGHNKIYFMQQNQKCQYTFCNFSDVPIHHSEPYSQTLCRDHGDRV